jgi:hypothetical protein
MRYRNYLTAGNSYDAGGPTRYGHHREEAVATPPVQQPLAVQVTDAPAANDAAVTDAATPATAPGESRL